MLLNNAQYFLNGPHSLPARACNTCFDWLSVSECGVGDSQIWYHLYLKSLWPSVSLYSYASIPDNSLQQTDLQYWHARAPLWRGVLSSMSPFNLTIKIQPDVDPKINEVVRESSPAYFKLFRSCPSVLNQSNSHHRSPMPKSFAPTDSPFLLLVYTTLNAQNWSYTALSRAAPIAKPSSLPKPVYATLARLITSFNRPIIFLFLRCVLISILIGHILTVFRARHQFFMTYQCGKLNFTFRIMCGYSAMNFLSL